MIDPLFTEIDKFDNWARSLYSIPQDDIGGEWECGYKDWGQIYSAFEAFVSSADPTSWSDPEKGRLLYIIARDNETELLAHDLPDQAVIVLAAYALSNGHRDDKFQLAKRLSIISDEEIAANLLEQLVNDEDEYVCRIALMELAKVKAEKIEYYAELFWNRNKYGEMDEYQKMAVLQSLKASGSKQLGHYIQLAKQQGGQYLQQSASRLQGE